MVGLWLRTPAAGCEDEVEPERALRLRSRRTGLLQCTHPVLLQKQTARSADMLALYRIGIRLVLAVQVVQTSLAMAALPATWSSADYGRSWGAPTASSGPTLKAPSPAVAKTWSM